MKRYHSYDNSTHINYPDTIKVHEHKAPTDDSVKLLEEMHDKAMKNIIAKVKVDDNLVSGNCYLIDQSWCIDNFKVVFKFKINGKEFTLEREISRDKLWDNETSSLVRNINQQLGDYAKSVLLWYSLKMFTTVAYEQITGQKPPELIFK